VQVTVKKRIEIAIAFVLIIRKDVDRKKKGRALRMTFFGKKGC